MLGAYIAYIHILIISAGRTVNPCKINKNFWQSISWFGYYPDILGKKNVDITFCLLHTITTQTNLTWSILFMLSPNPFGGLRWSIHFE
jgi:hypothetical protein